MAIVRLELSGEGDSAREGESVGMVAGDREGRYKGKEKGAVYVARNQVGLTSGWKV